VDAYFMEDNLDKAANLYLSILRKYPDFSYKPLVYLRLAQVAAKKGNWSQKNKYLELIKTDFRDSLEYELAKRLAQRGDYFTVQVGAFSKKSNALQLVRKLKPRYSAYIVEETGQDLVLYKVRVGKFKRKSEVQVVYDRLLKDGYSARIYP
jgi:hypothetical protein